MRPEFLSAFKRDGNGVYLQGDHVSDAVSYPDGEHERLMTIEAQSSWFRHRNHVILHFVQKYLSGGSLCDVGGGNGFVAAHLQAHGINTVVFEPGYHGCLNALKRGVRTVVCSTVESAPGRGSFGAVGLFDVLEHIQDERKFLQAVHALLRPNGLLFITVPAYPWLWSAEDVRAGHHRRYTMERLQDALAGQGFRYRDASYFFQCLVPLIFLFRVLLGKLIGRVSPRENSMWPLIAHLTDRELRAIHQRGLRWGASIMCVAQRQSE